MYAQNLITAMALLAACAALVWLRTGHGHPARASRERLRVVGWCTGLLLIALTVFGAFGPLRLSRRPSSGWASRAWPWPPPPARRVTGSRAS